MANLNDDGDFVQEAKLAAMGKHRIQTLAFQVLHDEVGVAAVVAEVIYGNDVGVLQAAERLRFAKKSA